MGDDIPLRLFGYNRQNSILENVYSLVNIESNQMVGNIVYYHADNSTVQNVYSVSIGENTTDLTDGPNVHYKGSKKIYNNYYFADQIFTSELETKGNMLSLWDAQFQNQLINSDGAFIVDDLVNEGYYPHVNMPDVMPAQEYIELPEVKDADLPDILSTKVLEQGTDTVKVQFSVNNPSAEQISDIKIQNLDVEILSQEYNNGKSTVIAELKNPVICVSSYDVLNISTKGAFGSSYTRSYEDGERVINVNLYNEIWSINDWKAINDSPTENYMIMTDLNMINEGNNVRINNVHGIINGNGHTISDINLMNNSSLILNLYGTLENMYIKNYNQETTVSGGLIGDVMTSATIDNVHMSDVHITKTGSGDVGGLARYAGVAYIRNCSVNNIQIDTEGNQDTLNLGGIVGRINNSSIENCYVKGLIINDSKGINSGIGGIVGAGTNSNNIINCYAEGKINSVNLNVGGIIGSSNTANINNCYSKVDISSTNSNVGGIIGSYSGSSLNTISNNISIGNIYTTSGLNSLSRILGTNSNTSSNNYAYENQLLNGYIREEEKGATLLSKEEILNLDLGDSYNYDGKENGVLPKLYNTEGTELLPNQEDIYLDDTSESDVNLDVEKVEATKPNTTEAEISVTINNSNEVEITGIEIEDMTVSSITRNVTQNGITSITVRATPNRYYDSYKLTGIKYKNASSEEKTKDVEVEVEVQFYKEIYTYEDWQSIEEGSYQNYRLMADIDFSGKDNVKNNITVNRLEAENNVYTLKNITLEFNTANSGLINNVKTSIKNIGFENITLTNTTGSGSYFGVIASNNGNIDNLQFNETTIDGENIDYIGLIGGITSGNINEINVKDIKIKGKDYTGGIIGCINISVDATVNNITGDNVTVESNGNYIGGLIGQQSGNTVATSNLKINNSNVTGKNYSGGIIGLLNYGSLRYIETNNTNISGTSYVGGIAGRFTTTDGSQYIRYNLQTNSSTINGTGNYIGGIAGYFDHGHNRYLAVNDTEINATSTNSQNIGGVVGNSYWSSIYYFQISDTKINSNGENVGGVGNDSSGGQFRIYYGYIENITVQGNANVGGIFGNTIYSTADTIFLNANVKANLYTAGGAIAYLDNSAMTAATRRIEMFNVIIADSVVTAPTKSGGYFGDIAKEIYRDQSFYYNNYIDADVTSTNSSTCSLIIGGRPDENDYITNTYVYKYSTLNGNYVYTTNDNIDNTQYLVRDDLNQQSTFSNKIGLGTTFWNYTPLQEGKYPKIKDNYLYLPELQVEVDLPEDPDITIINSLSNDDENDDKSRKDATNENEIATQNLKALPSWKVYPISVNEINVDFSSIPEGVSFTYYINGQEKEIIELTKKSYTFKYNYQDTLEIKLTNGQDEATIIINPDDVKSEASLLGSNNAYLLGTNLYINGELQPGEYVNVYDDYALNSSGQVVDIATKQMVKNADTTDDNAETSGEAVTTTLEETTKPLHTYDYKGNNIAVYGTYSTVDGNVKLQIYNVRNGQLSAISNNVDMEIGNSIVDNYNDKEYQTILTTSGELVDLKEQLQYPNNFLSSNIKQIVQNTDAEKPEMMVLYNTGKVIVFNYVTGQVTYENDEKAVSGLVSYLTRSFANIWSDYEDKQQEYQRSKELETKLAKLPVEEAMKENMIENITSSETNTIEKNNINTEINSIVNNNVSNTTADNNYITVYNADTGEYEVYSEDEILNGEDENPISETEKIKENGLEGIYGYDAKEETKPQANGAIIVVSIIAVAIIALIILRKVIVKNNNKKEKANKIKTN